MHAWNYVRRIQVGGWLGCTAWEGVWVVGWQWVSGCGWQGQWLAVVGGLMHQSWADDVSGPATMAAPRAWLNPLSLVLHVLPVPQAVCDSLPDDSEAIGHLDGDTAVSRGTFRAALAAAGAVCTAVDAVMKGEVGAGVRTYGRQRPGTASYASCCWVCFTTNLLMH